MNDVWYPGSIITFPRQLFLWDVANAAEIRPHSLDLLDVIKPYPVYVIIGTGKDKFEIPTSTYERFVKRGIKVEILPTVPIFFFIIYIFFNFSDFLSLKLAVLSMFVWKMVKMFAPF